MTHATSPGSPEAGRQDAGGIRSFRRAAVVAVIVSLSITAIIGIVTLLGGSFGEVQGKVMLSTLVVGAYSIALLADLAVAGREVRWVGYAGILVSSVCAIAALLLIWADFGGTESEPIRKTFWVTLVLAGSLAQVNLLLLLARRRHPAVRWGLWATIGLAVVLAVLLLLLILTDGEVGSENYARLLGVVAILDVLGTIVVPVLSRVFPERGRARTAPRETSIDLPPRLAAQLEAIAGRRSIAVSALAAEILERYVAEVGPGETDAEGRA